MSAMLASSSRDSGLMPAHQEKPINRSVHSTQLQRKSSCACGGGCPRCSAGSETDDIARVSRLQKKLSIGASNDPLEQEADRVADQVMASSPHSAVSSSAPRIQRFTRHAAEAPNNTVPVSVDRVLATSGKPLEASIQQEMGQRFGSDFSNVRVHSGAAAEQSARDVNANAYTVGNNIVFGAGQYTPATNQGRRLLAHELTHVVQQSGGSVPAMQSIISHQNSDISDGSNQKISNVSRLHLARSSYPEVNSAPIGLMRSLSPCLDRCEKQFNECVDQGRSSLECIAARSNCQRSCPPACAVSKEQIAIITTPTVVFDDKVLMQTDVDIEWKASENCDCACNEYRQYVKGHILKNGTSFNIGLCGGAKLEENVWHEDGDASTGMCYGHRESTATNNDKFDMPDRASGSHYHGKDEPNVPGKAGDMIDVDLKFKGQTYDRCSDTFGVIHEWAFTYKGSLGGIN